MRIIKLSEGLSTSQIVLGIAHAGVSHTEETAFAMWERYVELGGNSFDTARVYSDWVEGERHRSERILGDWLKSSGLRDRLVVATKCAHPAIGNWDVHRISRQEIHDDLYGSLETLRIDRIDLYYLHFDAPEVPADEIIDMLAEHVDEGLIGELGCSNWGPERIDAANRFAEREGKKRFVAHEVFWNIGSSNMAPDTRHHRELDSDGYAMLTKWKMTPTAFTSQAGGYFTKLTSESKESVEKAESSWYHTSDNEALAALIQEIAEKHRCSVNQVVLAYLLNQKLPTAPIIGARTVEQLEESLASIEVALTDEDRDRLREAANQDWAG